MARKLVEVGKFRSTADQRKDVEMLATIVSRALLDIENRIPQKGVSGTFTSADTPAKTITVVDGVVTGVV